MKTNEIRPDEQEASTFNPLRSARTRSTTPRRFPDIGSLLGYTVASVMVAVGGLVVAGYLVHEGVPDKFRWTFGVVLVLMGIYRFFMTQIRRQQKALEREDET